MGRWDEKILAAADKISQGIDKGTDRLLGSENKQSKPVVQQPQIVNQSVKEVRHCPSCGHIIDSLDLFCPACGTSMETSVISSAAQNLANSLAEIDSQKEGIIRNYIRTHQDKVSDKAIQKAQIIRSYPVPNTKKDLLEFTHMAAANINTKVMLGANENSSLDADAKRTEKLLSEAWLEKMEAVYQKSRSLLGSTDMEKIESIYQTKKREISSLQEALRKKSKKENRVLLIVVIIILIGAGIGVFFGIRGENQAKVEKKNNLESLVIEIRQDITDGNYNEALLKTNQVRLKDGGSAEEEAQWDRTRETLVKEIENARKKGN